MTTVRRILALVVLAAAFAGSAAATTPAAVPDLRVPNRPAWENEARQLHEFFLGWYRGEIADTDENYARLADVLADDFMLITTGGFCVSREQMLQMMRGEHGTKPDLRLDTDGYSLRFEEGGVVLFTYRENGETGGRRKSSLISVVMRKAPGTPNGLRWVHLHEVAAPVEN